MTDLEKYESVNKTETLLELSKVIESFAENDGKIQGRTKKFNATEMAYTCRNFDKYSPNILTREFNIRQQAMYLKYYGR